ncbi:hypothetical protein [Myxococcus sp. RHSTA-1-4]|uniref:DUF7151 family protein n=1 Tax=Myxococcus sp. RHSTA-1-4 TaxID=2874601 RepID=UPI001CBC7E40|nr:hypothetical protein [Myxococcus sp. RHSTA-1-4]MBZ4416057.1 hypothetical protein [Myxococcus sp. RHSTA-1-4]
MRWTWMAVLALAAGCGGIELEPLVNQHPARTRVTPEPPGAHCPHGGSALLSGLDLDEDGVLDDGEVTATEYVCATALAHSQPETAGAHCEHGGQAVRTGPDLDGDGELDDAEVTATEYVCATAVPDVLVRTREVPPGAECPLGGQVSRAGQDTNGNGELEDGEVTREVYGCTQPETVVTRLSAIPQPAQECPGLASVAVEAGPDMDQDGELDDGEARARVSLCASVVDPVRVELRPEPAGTRCPAGGTLVVAGLDVNGDGNLGNEERSSWALVCQPLHTYDGSYVVRSAADLAALQGISHIHGSLFLMGTELTEVVLPGLMAVEGQLTIYGNAALTRVELPGLRFVKYDLSVESNANLETLVLGGAQGEELLVELDLWLISNPKLKSLSGLSRVSPRQSLYLRENGALEYIPGQTGFDNVKALTGVLYVSGNDALGALPFPVLRHVGYSVYVDDNTALRSLSLPSLRSVGGAFSISNNDALQGLSGMPLLETINSWLTVAGNDALRTTEGLPELSHVGGLSFGFNAELEWVGDLPSLQSIGSRLVVDSHPKLLGVRNLGSLQQVAQVSIDNNPLLASLQGLTRVRWLSSLSVRRSPALSSLAELAGLQEVEMLSVLDNANLTRFDLTALERVPHEFTVTGNTKLPTCLATGLAAAVYTGAPAQLRISDNDDTATCGN